MQSAILLFNCKDQKGIVAHISDFIFKHNANIIVADQYSTDHENGYFFIRIEFWFNNQEISLAKIKKDFEQIASKFQANWQIVDNFNTKLKMGIMVSQTDHCLAELLYNIRAGELQVEVPFVIANHDEHAELVKAYNIPYYVITATNTDRKEQEILALLQQTDFLVLARYMQILSNEFIESYGKDIINIHHSFLPSFKGANPYLQAYERGVKVIGATAHFVTGDLDEGPIIEQKVETVTHRDSVDDLRQKGKNLEKLALIKAVKNYVDYKVMRLQNKTIVF